MFGNLKGQIQVGRWRLIADCCLRGKRLEPIGRHRQPVATRSLSGNVKFALLAGLRFQDRGGSSLLDRDPCMGNACATCIMYGSSDGKGLIGKKRWYLTRQNRNKKNRKKEWLQRMTPGL